MLGTMDISTVLVSDMANIIAVSLAMALAVALTVAIAVTFGVTMALTMALDVTLTVAIAMICTMTVAVDLTMDIAIGSRMTILVAFKDALMGVTIVVLNNLAVLETVGSFMTPAVAGEMAFDSASVSVMSVAVISLIGVALIMAFSAVAAPDTSVTLISGKEIIRAWAIILRIFTREATKPLFFEDLAIKHVTVDCLEGPRVILDVTMIFVLFEQCLNLDSGDGCES